MGKLRDQMIEDLQLRDYARGTCKAYVDCARAFVAYHRKPPQQMGELEIRQFLMHLVETKKASPASRKMHVAGIKFLYEVTLRRPEVVASIPWPKVPHGVPEILSGSEVMSLLDAIEAIKHRAVILTAYGAGLRVSEVCSLQVDDIDSKRMTIRVRLGKGNKARYVILPERVLFLLRRYWAIERPKKPWLFAGNQAGCPLSPASVRYHLNAAAKKTGLTKRVHAPHLEALVCDASARARHRHPRHPDAPRSSLDPVDHALHADDTADPREDDKPGRRPRHAAAEDDRLTRPARARAPAHRGAR